MLHTLIDKPSKPVTRILLIVGLLIFISVYSYIIRLFSNMGVDTSEFNSVWLSFESRQFEVFLERLEEQGHLETFISSFWFNLLSMTGFMLTFFSSALIIARKLPLDSRLSRGAYFFPTIAILVAALDIIPSLLLLSVANSLPNMSHWLAWTISGGYLIRVLLLYALLLWMLVTGASLLISKLRGT